ncbi:putative AlkP superfamily pyrophosphatase or phosphodiesterase [Salirhabdus euzebyi]|uniref:Putative AlkP superfamily pyrophosphatase or phosphodiesterase n=1 Tax=Salirhabdus euzebyi TaxID=394506 RepID=A0A841Q4H4_9BACI|nr:alkaline phosphatase family protein [Salirhabdus euzebyi]MBB6453329.1 putative AlkP superfamily pyrophosphatase or phosphodiesterase [Salirhabdus euzebyi]
MKKLMYILLIILIVTGIILFFKGRQPANQSLDEKKVNPVQKPVVLLMVDSLMEKPLLQVINEGRAPALQFLMEKGHLYPDVVSSYPTMSVSIDSTLLTGVYPEHHRVPGLVWFDEKNKELINYGSAREEILKLGYKNVIENSLFHLNHTHLSREVKTIHEELALQGFQSSTINALIYRGPEKTTITFPEALSNVDVLPEGYDIETPELFSYGAFAQFSPVNKNNNQIWEAYGFNDKFSTQELKYLMENNKLPAFTLAYFSDLDKEVHKSGAEKHLNAIEKVDIQLQELLNTYESWEEAIKDKVWIVMGDSGQADVHEAKEEGLINLHEIFHSFTIHRIAEPIKDEDQLVLALNERMAFIHRLDSTIQIEELVGKLQQDERIGFIAWKNNEGQNVVAGNNEERLVFQPNGPTIDPYEKSWTVEGNLALLDISVNDNTITYGNYPDALARLHSSLRSHQGNYLVVDAKPGYEFVAEGTPTHPGGGSHGSLHKQDAMVPMIVTGTDTKPLHMRMVDLKQWILQIINSK